MIVEMSFTQLKVLSHIHCVLECTTNILSVVSYKNAINGGKTFRKD